MSQRTVSEFPIGSTVRWTSAGKEKTGEVVAFCPAGKRPKDVADALGFGISHDTTTALNGSGPRSRDTVLVRVPGEGAQQPVIYRPLLSRLSVVGDARGAAPKAEPTKAEKPVAQVVAERIQKPAAPAGLVNHIGIALDTSGSMTNQGVIAPATAAMNEQIHTVQEQARKSGQRTDISFLTFDQPWNIRREATAKPAEQFRPFSVFAAHGAGTALFDATAALVEDLRKLPDAADPNVSFLLLILTDGGENASRHYNAARLRALLQEVQATDRWTVAFLVPPGTFKRDLVAALGVPEGNVQEWNVSEAGAKRAGQMAAAGTEAFYEARAAGKTSTKEFFGINLSKLGPSELKKLVNVTPVLKTRKVDKSGRKIGEFMEAWTKRDYIRGSGYYPFGLREELLKKGRGIIIRKRGDSTFYGGPAMRDVIGIPSDREVTIRPENLGEWEMWVESGSDNRGLQLGTIILWKTDHTGGTVPTWQSAHNGTQQPVGAK